MTTVRLARRRAWVRLPVADRADPPATWAPGTLRPVRRA